MINNPRYTYHKRGYHPRSSAEIYTPDDRRLYVPRCDSSLTEYYPSDYHDTDDKKEGTSSSLPDPADEFEDFSDIF